MTVLYQRNALSTIFKNYDDENLERVLPAALLLCVRRAYVATKIDSSPLRSELRAIAPHLHTEVPHPNALHLRPGSYAAGQHMYNAAYYLRETWRTLRDDGPAQLWRKVIAELDRRWQNRPRLQRDSGRRRYQQSKPGHTFVDKQAISHLIAADDLVRNWEHLVEKRQAVQGRRRRSDQEIFALFHWMFETDDLNPHYTQTLKDLIEFCGIRDFFGGDGRNHELGVDH